MLVRMRGNQDSSNCWWEYELVNHQDICYGSSSKTKTKLSHGPAIRSFGIHLQESQAASNKNICISTFISAQCAIAKIGKQCWCPSKINVISINQSIYTDLHSYDSNSAIKKNKIQNLGKWMAKEMIMLREINQIEKDKQHMFSLICGIFLKK